MSRPRNAIQYSFEGGEADPQYERRADADLWLITAKRMRNVRLTNGGGFARRPGLARVTSLTGAARLREFVSRAGDKRLLALRTGGAMDVFTEAEALEATVTGGDWGAGDLASMQLAFDNDRIVVTSRSFWPQNIAWDGAAFTIGDLAFYTRGDGSKGQPYYRFVETKGITLTPSATSGAGVTITASAAAFVAGHVGCRFRILGREFEVTAFTDTTHVTATCIQTLQPTRRLTVASTTGFAVGDQAQSSVDDIDMEVTGIVSGTELDVLLIDTFTDPSTASNTLLGPNASSAISAVGAAAGNGATTQWDEQMISAVRGYPGGCCFHKNRLVLLDFPKAPEVHALSVLAEASDFDTGDGLDDEAIIDGPGDAMGRRARHCLSSEQLLSLTEVGSYYVGEGPNTPVTPTTVEFLRIGPEPAGTCNPVMASEGAIFAETQGDRMMLLAPSGQLRRVWGATEILAFASELLSSPSRLLLVDGSEWGPERYLLAINTDGTLLAVHYRRDSEITGASLWTTEGGTFVDVAAFGRKVYACVLRSGAYTLERFDIDRLLDNSVLIANAASATPSHASWVNRSIALVWRKSVSGEARRVDIGEYAATGGGVLTDAPTAARDYEGGSRFFPLITLWPPIDPELGVANYQRVARAGVDILRSGQFYLNGQRFTAYRMSDDVSEPPPLRTGWRRRGLSGRKRDFEASLTQIEAAPFEVRCMTLEVR